MRGRRSRDEESGPGRGAVLALVAIAAALLPAPAGAAASVPFQDEGVASGPLTHIAIGNDLSCQVEHTGDTTLELYPPGATPGDCGTFLYAGGTLYAPDFAHHDNTATGPLGSTTPFTPVSQTSVTGSGSSSDPYQVVTVADAAGANLRVSETDTYTNGAESYRSDVTVTNRGGSAQDVMLYRAGDCYLQNTDYGYGFTDSSGPGGAVGCSANPNNSPAGRIEEWVPITGGNSWVENEYGSVWSEIGAHGPLPDSCDCTTNLDNGAGIAWSFSVAPGASVTRSHYTTFSASGISGGGGAVSCTELGGGWVDASTDLFSTEKSAGSTVKLSASAKPGPLTYCSSGDIASIPSWDESHGSLELDVSRPSASAPEGEFVFSWGEPVEFRNPATGRVYHGGDYKFGDLAEIKLPPDSLQLALDQHGEVSLQLASVTVHTDSVRLDLPPLQPGAAHSVLAAASPEADLSVSFDPREIVARFVEAFQALQALDALDRLLAAEEFTGNVMIDVVDEEVRDVIAAGDLPSDTLTVVDQSLTDQILEAFPSPPSDSSSGNGLERAAPVAAVGVVVVLGLIFAPEITVPALGGAALAAAGHSALVPPSYVPPRVLRAAHVRTLKGVALHRAPFPGGRIVAFTHAVLPAPVPSVVRPIAVDRARFRPRSHLIVVAGRLPNRRRHRIVLVLAGPRYRAERIVVARRGVAAARITLPARLGPGAWTIAFEDLSGLRVRHRRLSGRAQDRLGIFTVRGARRRPARRPRASITSVAFGGAPSDPQVTIYGRRLGAPPSPTMLAYPGYTGEDYGDALSLCDTSNDPSAFCAGQSGPSGHDLIGLVVTGYTPARITYTLGSTYSQSYYPGGVYRLREGDGFTVKVRGLTCRGTVDFSGTPRGCAR